MIRIKIEGKNIADIWSLACVKTITKAPDGNMIVAVKDKTRSYFGLIGDIIEVESEQSKTGKIIEKRADLL